MLVVTFEFSIFIGVGWSLSQKVRCSLSLCVF